MENLYSLMKSIYTDSHTDVEKNLSLNEKNINTTDKYGCTPLMYAAFHNSHKVAHLLIKRGAHLEASNLHGKTPLMFACENDSKEVFELLLNNGANPLQTNIHGDSVIEVAEALGFRDILRTLKAKGYETKNSLR